MYSNCLVEAVKAKIKNWKNVEIHKIPAKFEGHLFPHFWWSIGDEAFDFKCDNPKTELQVLLFKGHIRSAKKACYDVTVNQGFSRYVNKLEQRYGKVTEFESTEDLKSEIDSLKWLNMKDVKPQGDENWISVVYLNNGKITSSIIQVKDLSNYPEVLRWKYENMLVTDLEIAYDL